MRVESTFTGAGGAPINIVAKFKIPFTYQNEYFEHEFYVASNLRNHAIVGNDLIQKMNLGYIPKQNLGARRRLQTISSTEMASPKNPQYFDIKTTKNLHISSREVQWVTVNVLTNETPLANSELHADINHPSLSVHCPPQECLLKTNADGTAWVPIINDSVQNILIPKGTKIGYGYKIDPSSLCPVQIGPPAQIDSTMYGINLPPPGSDSETLKNAPQNHSNHLSFQKNTPAKISPPTSADKNFIRKTANLQDVPPHLREKYYNLLIKYHEVFSRHQNDLGSGLPAYHHIPLTVQHPVTIKQFPLPKMYDGYIREQIQEWERLGIVQKSSSNFNFPIFGVKKKDAEGNPTKIRVVLDFRELNKVTKPSNYRLPHIQELLDELEGTKLFSSLDLSQSFYQLPLHPNDRHKTAFSIPGS